MAQLLWDAGHPPVGGRGDALLAAGAALDPWLAFSQAVFGFEASWDVRLQSQVLVLRDESSPPSISPQAAHSCSPSSARRSRGLLRGPFACWKWGVQGERPQRREFAPGDMRRSLAIWRGTGARLTLPRLLPRLDTELQHVSERWPRFWREYWGQEASVQQAFTCPRELMAGNDFGDSVVCDLFTLFECINEAGSL